MSSAKVVLMKSIISWLRRRGKTLPPAREGSSDGLSRLPLELHFYVLAHFEPEDFVVALGVCRSWRYVWLSDEVWPWLAARWLPGLVEQINFSAETEKEKGGTFQHALVKQCQRRHGCFSRALLHGLQLEADSFFKLNKSVAVTDGGIHSYLDARDPEPDLNRFARFRLYNSGRIAWWPEPYALPYLAVIDDLRTRERRVYSFPHHRGEQAGYQIALGDKLFIMGKEHILHVWHLENNTHLEVELPYHFKRCVTERETVLIVAKDSAVYLWKFGQGLESVDMSSIYERAPVTLGDQGDFVLSVLGPHRVGLWLRSKNIAIDFIIHPTEEDVLFAVTLRAGTLTVHELQHGRLVNSYKLGETMLSPRALELSRQLRWEKIDSRGGYNLLSIYPTPWGTPAEDHDFDELCREISCRCQTWWQVGGHTLVSVCFNVYTKTFQVLRHQPPSFHQPKTFHIWNDQLLGAARPQGPMGWYLASFKDGAGWTDARPFASVPFYSTTALKTVEPLIRKRRRMALDEFELHGLDVHAKAFRGVEYFLDGSRTFHRRRTPVQEQRPDTLRLVGDDDFLLFFEDEIYTVWFYGDTTEEK
jgi:hypothetical protein